jgi:outer membrane murein-binding lipoprotein Lpp
MGDVMWPAVAVLFAGLLALACIGLLMSDSDVDDAHQDVQRLRAEIRRLAIDLAASRNDTRKALLELEFERSIRPRRPGPLPLPADVDEALFDHAPSPVSDAVWLDLVARLDGKGPS